MHGGFGVSGILRGKSVRGREGAVSGQRRGGAVDKDSEMFCNSLSSYVYGANINPTLSVGKLHNVPNVSIPILHGEVGNVPNVSTPILHGDVCNPVHQTGRGSPPASVNNNVSAFNTPVFNDVVSNNESGVINASESESDGENTSFLRMRNNVMPVHNTIPNKVFNCCFQNIAGFNKPKRGDFISFLEVNKPTICGVVEHWQCFESDLPSHPQYKCWGVCRDDKRRGLMKVGLVKRTVFRCPRVKNTCFLSKCGFRCQNVNVLLRWYIARQGIHCID